MQTPNVYWSLLSAVASGANRISEIAVRVGQPANKLTRYLSALSEMGLVRRHVPVTAPNPAKSKRGLYQLDDPFLRLWYGCVAPFRSLLELGRVAEVESLMAKRLLRHQAWAFEEVCRQHAEERLATEGVVRVGRHWDRHCEVDVVGVDEDGRVALAGECKWTSRPAPAALGRSLAAKVAHLWPDRARDIRLAIYSAAGFSEGLQAWAAETSARLVPLDELAE